MTQPQPDEFRITGDEPRDRVSISSSSSIWDMELLEGALEHCKQDRVKLMAEVEQLRKELALRDDSLANRRVRQLREALRAAIGWSYGNDFTPEQRNELERLLDA